MIIPFPIWWESRKKVHGSSHHPPGITVSIMSNYHCFPMGFPWIFASVSRACRSAIASQDQGFLRWRHLISIPCFFMFFLWVFYVFYMHLYAFICFNRDINGIRIEIFPTRMGISRGLTHHNSVLLVGYHTKWGYFRPSCDDHHLISMVYICGLIGQ